MKNTTPLKLSKRLAKYGALTVAIAGVADVSGQIIYTDVNPDVTLIAGDYLIDMDNDGTGVDPTVGGESGDADELLFRQGNNYNRVAPYSPGDGLLGSSSGFIYPFALNFDDVISSGQTTWFPYNGFFQTMNYNSCGYPGSNWCSGSGSGSEDGVTDKYLGVRFDIGGYTHYGWVRLDAANNAAGFGMTIKDYAYNSMRDLQITAGEGLPLGIDDNELSNIKIVALNKSVALFNLPQQTNYILFSLTGQSVLDGKIANSTHVIEANTLATGVYILELKDTDSNAVIRKKIVL